MTVGLHRTPEDFRLKPAWPDLVGVAEIAHDKDIYKPELVEWAKKLPSLPDEEFISECSNAIYESALVSRFRGIWEHVHFKASACSWDARRRHLQAGNSEECRGDTLYAVACSRAVRSAGHPSSEPTACTCKTRENR